MTLHTTTTETPRIGVITNPNSKKNRRRALRRAELERAGRGHAVVRETPDVDALPGAIEELLDARCQYWVSDGGDGSLHWMLSTADQVIESRRQSGIATEWPAVMPSNGGTIDFVAKKVGIRGHAEDIVAALGRGIDRGQAPRIVEVDTLRVVGTPTCGGTERFDRIGFASAIGGAAQRFFAKYYEDDVPGPGTIVKIITGAVASYVADSVGGPAPGFVPETLRHYGDVLRPTPARVEVDGVELPHQDFISLQVGAIEINLGGVVRTFRLAGPLGSLHLQALSFGPAELVANMPCLVAGTPPRGDASKIYDREAREIRVTAPPGQPLDPVIDGECFHGLDDLTVTLGPRMRIPAICT